MEIWPTMTKVWTFIYIIRICRAKFRSPVSISPIWLMIESQKFYTKLSYNPTSFVSLCIVPILYDTLEHLQCCAIGYGKAKQWLGFTKLVGDLFIKIPTNLKSPSINTIFITWEIRNPSINTKSIWNPSISRKLEKSNHIYNI